MDDDAGDVSWPWATPSWRSLNPEGLRGWVRDFDEAASVLKMFESAKSLHFVGNRKTPDFGCHYLAGASTTSVDLGVHVRADKSSSETAFSSYMIRFSDENQQIVPFDGVPFITTGSYTLDCLYGRNKHKCAQEQKKKEIELEMQADHPIPHKRRKRIQCSKKKGCPATVLMKEIIRFPHFKASSQSKRARSDASWALREAIRSGTQVATEHRIYIAFPSDQVHQDTHPTGMLTGFFNPINRRVRDKVEELVGYGVTTVSEARRHLNMFIETVLFPNPKARPNPSDTAYYPPDHVIRNHIYAARMKLRYSKLDQQNLQKLVEEWREQNPNDNYKLVLATEPSDENEVQGDDMGDGEEDDEVLPVPKETDSCGSAFFFCHQTEYQRHLLQRYGNDLCLLDATYRTTKYELPLFFLAVKTNFGYSVVGEFVVMFETVQAIQEGLQTIKHWMEEDGKVWRPRFFMTDFSEREIRAIENTFAGNRSLKDLKVFKCIENALNVGNSLEMNEN